MRRKSINSQAVIEAACFILFGAAMLYLLYSGRYLSYVTPRMKPYLYFTAIVTGIWAAASIKGMHGTVYRKRTGRYCVLLIPVILLLLPHEGMGVANLSGSTGLLTGSAIGSISEADSTAPSDTAPPEEPEPVQPEPTAEDPPEQETAEDDVYMSTNVYNDPIPLHGYDGINRMIIVNNDEFYLWLGEFFMHLESFEGFQVTMTGAVYRDPVDFAWDEFVPARLVMSCCVADLAPCGLICKYDKTEELVDNTWVTVTGTLQRGQYQGQDEPQLQVISIVPAEPVKGYIFPYL